MPTQEQLKARAIRDCRDHVEQTLQGEFYIEPTGFDQEWNPRLLRSLFEQDMVVWRRCSNFHVYLGPDNQPVGFEDEDKWAGCEWCELTRVYVVQLAAATGFVPVGSSVLSYSRGPKNCLEAILSTNPSMVDAPQYFVRINPARARLIAIHPVKHSAWRRTMNETNARIAAEAARGQHQIPAEASLTGIERRYIELPQSNREVPGLVADVFVWVARFEDERGWTDLAIRDLDGQVARVERSRAAVLWHCLAGIQYPELAGPSD